MYIFKIAQVISENIRIAFLYVLSIHFYFTSFKISSVKKHIVNKCILKNHFALHYSIVKTNISNLIKFYDNMDFRVMGQIL